MQQLLERYTIDFISFFIGFIVISWLMMVAAVLLDLWTGLEKARARGERIASHQLRHTIEKIGDYWRVQAFGLIIDLMISIWVSVPYASMVVTFGIILIECRSVIENLRAKKSDASNVMEAVAMIKKAITDKDAESVLEYLTKRDSDNEKIDNE